MIDMHLHDCDPADTKKAIEALNMLAHVPAFTYLIDEYLLGTYREVVLEGLASPSKLTNAREKEALILKLSALAQLKSFLKELQNFDEVLTMLEDSNI